MPFFVFRVSRQSPAPLLLKAFPEERFGEADAYRLADAFLRKLRRNSSPDQAHYYYTVYGYTESEARRRLNAQLTPKAAPKRPAPPEP